MYTYICTTGEVNADPLQKDSNKTATQTNKNIDEVEKRPETMMPNQ